MAEPPTILAVKQAFLDRETRLLAQPLAPSRVWQRGNDSRRRSAAAQQHQQPDSTGRRLPDKAVDDAVLRVNQLLQQHARRVYAPQATRHVAEQLDQLYWQAGEQAIPGAGGVHEGDMDLEADYTRPSAIDSLPPAWDDERDAQESPMEARRYEELVEQLQTLSARKIEAQARVQRLRQMRGLLAPFADTAGRQEFEAYDDSDTTSKQLSRQDSVVTRNGPVEKELERMRVLLARVGDRVATLQQSNDGSAGTSVLPVDDVETASRKRVQALLEQF